MITVNYDRNHHRLRILGHATSAPTGKDLVCAAVSGLVYTMAWNVAELVSQGNAAHQQLRLSEGDALIACVPKKGMANVVTLVFDSVCSGFALLQNFYPEQVKYVVW